MTDKLKKQLILNLPYLIFVYLFDKLCQGVRLAPGADASEKLLHIGQGFSAAFASLAPSFHLLDLCMGAAGAVLIRLAVYSKGKNAKKYRRGIEYGSARWGTPADIAPYADPDFFQNVLLTQTERITMSSRPKEPKYARNKNILVIGGSGSGKTRFFVKPNLLQCHSSYVVTDPKGTILCEVGALLERKGYRIKSLNLINFKKSIYSVAVTVLAGWLVGLGGFSSTVLLQQGTQVIAPAFTTGLVCMPMILIFGQIRGAYLGGSLLTFFLGYCILFFKGGFLLSAYPFSAALILAGFDMQEYNGATQAPSVLLALAGMAAVLVLTMAILLLSHPSQKAGNSKRKKVKKGRGRRRAR